MSVLLCVSPAIAQRKKAPPPQLGQVTIDQYRQLDWRPETGYFHSPGPVRIVLEDAITGEKTTLLADDAEGQINGDIVVHGAVRIQRPEGNLFGEQLNYDADQQTGSILNARVDMSNLFLRGRQVELLPGRVIRAKDASFTTCIKERPDYHVTAKEIRISPNGKVNAKRVTFWIGRTRIISLPSLSRSFKRSSGSPVPLPSYSKDNFISLRFHDQAISEPATTLDYNIGLSFRRTPEGTVSYEHDFGRVSDEDAPPRTRLNVASEPMRTALELTPPPNLRDPVEPGDSRRRSTLYGLVTSNASVYNRKRTDLRVSRLPEIGVRLWNMSGRSLAPGRDTDPLQRLFYVGDWLLNADLGLGYFDERPGRSRGTRLSLTGTAASPLYPLFGGLHMRVGFTGWANAYDRGDRYTLLSPEFELDYLLRKNTLFGATYHYQKDFGQTPFLFDRLDIRHELRFRYGFLGAHWAYDLGVNYDMERQRAYDTIASIRKRFDCMEVGIGYSARSQGFTMIFNLLPVSARSKSTGQLVN